eukprot:UC1_evm1s1990
MTFYVPGVAPQEFADGDAVAVKSVKMTSVRRPKLPFPYYHLPFCRPQKLAHTGENLGEVLRGDRITNTPYDLRMNQNVTCRLLCRGDNDAMARSYTKKAVKKFESFIASGYRAHWLMDNLPVATRVSYGGDQHLVHGYPVGYVDQVGDDDTAAAVGVGGAKKSGAGGGSIKPGQTHLFNHLILVGRVHKTRTGESRIVGFEVKARSVAPSRYTLVGGGGSSSAAGGDNCVISPPTDGSGLAAGHLSLRGDSLPEDGSQDIVWSYGVEWVPSDVAWASRWDTYLEMDDVDIHWFSILNSLITVLLMSGVMAFIMVRTLRRDISRYNTMEDEEEAMEQTGWKLVHGDVFRAPSHSFWLSVCYGTGTQLLCMAASSIVFAALGMLSPASRGSLLTAALLFFFLFGIIGGYWGARLYKTLKGSNWKRAGLTTAILYPGLVLGIGFALNLLIWEKASSGAVPFTTMVALLALWFGISTPLVMIGYFFGYRKAPYEVPVKTHQIPRPVPEQPWYMASWFCVFVGGILPFGAVFIELYFILSAIWENNFYYLFGFLFLVFAILALSCAEVALVMTYLQLCGEDYHWWWRSFLVGGGSAFYVALYATYYYYTELNIDDTVSTMIYFGYSFSAAVGFWAMTGTVGFWASYKFVRKIYGSIKID